MFKGIFTAIAALVLFLAFVFGMSLFGFGMNSFFAPKYRALDNQVYKESTQYNEGMIRDLENLQLEYMKANDTQKAALKDIILHRFSVYDVNRLPNNLYTFYTKLRSGAI